MRIEEIFVLGAVGHDLQLEVTDFLDLCSDLEFLTEQENQTLLEKNGLKDHRTAYKKVVMLEKFEMEAAKVFNKVKTEAPNNLALHMFLIKKVQEFQEKLKVNTGLHLHLMGVSPYYGGRDTKTCH